MASTSDAETTKNVPPSSAATNGPGTVSDALAAFEAQAANLPAGPKPDPSVAVAYALGWAVGDALTCAGYQVFEHLVKVPELGAPSEQWNLLASQIVAHCSRLNIHLISTAADIG